MKKVLLAGAIVAVVGTAGYLYHNQDSLLAQADSESLLTQVPADSLIVTYQSEPINHYEYINAFGTVNQPSIAQLLEAEEADIPPEAAFLIHLFDDYLQSASSPETLKAYFGTGETINPIFYTLGMVPVYKLPIEDPAVLWSTLDRQEQKSGVSHETGTLGNVEYRRYALTEATELQQSVDLIVAVTDKVLTVTVDIPQLGEQNPLKMALGLEAPAANLADSGRLEALQAKYGNNNNSFAYVDHREIIKGITTADGNMLARQLTLIDAEDHILDETVRSPACHTEFTQIAENWPLTVGFVEYKADANQATLNGSFVIESNNTVIVDALKSMRGVLANSKSDKSFFSLALGLDANTLAPAIGKIWTDLTQPQYQCELLAEVQQEMKTQNPAMMLGMATSMVNGLKGLSIDLFDFQLNDNMKLDKLDMIFSMSANDPGMLLQSAQMFVPELAQIQVQPDDQAVNIGELVEQHTGVQTELFVRLNDKHLTMYSGEEATTISDNIMSQPLTPNGLMSFTLNSARMLEIVENTFNTMGEPLPEEVMMSLQDNVNSSTTLDITDHGVTFSLDYRSMTDNN